MKMLPKRQKTGGRKAGTPNKVTGAVRDMILGALDEMGGQQWLVKQANENPVAFMTLLGKVLPTQIQGDSENPLQVISMITRKIVRAGEGSERE